MPIICFQGWPSTRGLIWLRFVARQVVISITNDVSAMFTSFDRVRHQLPPATYPRPPALAAVTSVLQ